MTSTTTAAPVLPPLAALRRVIYALSHNQPLVFGQHRVHEAQRTIAYYSVPSRPTDIKHCRLAAGLSQVEFAAQLGMSIRSVRNWEQGITEPSAVSMAGIQRFFEHLWIEREKA